jgi:hypothetical protein
MKARKVKVSLPPRCKGSTRKVPLVVAEGFGGSYT